ncbi:MAG: HAMP domain-containing protein [Pleurocapsa sp. SU_196_0]|nr:HAMP domain-containing protein [Pleurocapsa sp. SU_196_0]
MSRVNTPGWWQRTRRQWRSIGSDLTRTMIGLVLITALVVFVVLGYAWTLYIEEVRRQGSQMLSSRFQIPAGQIEDVLREAQLRAQTTLDWAATNDLRQLALFSLFLLIVLLPTVLAWWAAKRFAAPLKQLSRAAHRMTTGDLSARVASNTAWQGRDDETAVLLEDFNSMAASLERLEHERRYSLAAIAHELRTPVTVLRGRLEGVRDGVLNANIQEFEKLINHADLLSKLIEDLQLLSLTEAGALPLERQDVNMHVFLKRLHTDYLGSAQERHVDLRLNLPTHNARVSGDERRLYQIFSNLLGNALRHTPAHGRISIGLVIQPNTVQLEIEDSGAGFTPEALTRAFERFYRSPDRARQQGGSGLGLTVSRSLVEAHGGSIALFNTPVGACVRVTLPKLEAHDEA